MSAKIDTMVLKAEFDNAQFESGIKQAINSMNSLADAANNLAKNNRANDLSLALGNLSNSVEKAFSTSTIGKVTAWGNVITRTIDGVLKAVGGMNKNFTGFSSPIDMINTAITKGVNRAANLENAKFTLSGLGVQWEKISDDIDYAVSGTAYGLDAAAKAASSLQASGVKFGETFGPTGNSPMAKALRGISGLAAMTNSSYEDISELFTAVAGKGKIQAMELNRFAYRGINVAATLAKEFNGIIDGSAEDIDKYSDSTIAAIKRLSDGRQITEADIRDLASKGKISFAMFSEASNAAFGDHAVEANKTYAGSLSNVGAALSRLGAKYFTPHRDSMIPYFNGLRVAINNVSAALDPLFQGIARVEKEVYKNVGNFLGSDTFKSIATSFGSIITSFSQMLYSVIVPIQQAFRSVFGHEIGEYIATAAKSVADFLDKIIVSEELVSRISWAFVGLFEVIKFLGLGLKEVAYILSPLLGIFNTGFMVIMDFLRMFGKGAKDLETGIENDEKKLTSLRNTIETLHSIVEGVAYAVRVAIVLVSMALEAVISKVGVVLTIAKQLAIILGAGIGTVIIAVVYGVMQLVSAFNDLVGWFKKGKDGVKSLGDEMNVFQFIAASLGEAFYKLKERFDLWFNTLKLLAPNISKEISQIFKTITGVDLEGLDPLKFLQDEWKKAVDGFKNLQKEIGSAFKENGIDGVLDLISEKIATLKDKFLKLRDDVSPAVESIKNKLGTFAEFAVKSFRLAFQGTVIGDIIDKIESIATKVSGFIAKITEGTKDIRPLFAQLETLGVPISKLSDPIELIFSAIEKLIEGIKKLRNFIKETKAAFADGGLKGGFDYLKGQFDTLVKTVSDTYNKVKPTLEQIGTAFKDNLETVFHNIGTMFANSKLGSTLSPIIQGIKDFGTTIAETFGNLNVTKIASSFGDTFGSLFRTISDSLRSGTFTKAGFFEVMENFAASIGDKFKHLFSFDTLKKLIDDVIGLFDKLLGGLKKFSDSISEGPLKTGLDWIVDKLEKLKNAISSFFNAFSSKDPSPLLTKFGKSVASVSGTSDTLTRSADETTENISKSSDKMSGILEKITNFANGVKSVYDSIKENLGDKVTAVLAFALGAALIVFFTSTIPKAILTVGRGIDTSKQALDKVSSEAKTFKTDIEKALTKFGNTIDSVVKGAIGTVKSIADGIKAVAKLHEVAKMVKAIGLAVLEISAGLYLLGQLKEDELIRAGIAMGAIVAAITVMVIIFTQLDKSYGKLTDGAREFIAKGSGAKGALAGAAALIVGLSVSMFVIAKALDTISKVQIVEGTGEALTEFGLMFGVFVASVILMAKYAPQLSKGGLILIALAATVALITNTFTKLVNTIKEGTTGENANAEKYMEAFHEAMKAMMVMFLGIAAICAGLSFVNASSGIGILALIASILLLKSAAMALVDFANYIASSDLNTIVALVGGFVGALAAFSILLTITKLAGKNALGAGVGLVAIIVAINLLIPLLVTLQFIAKTLQVYQISPVIRILLTIFAGIAGLMLATNKASAKALAAAPAIALLMLVFTGILGLVTLLVSIPGVQIDKGIEVLQKLTIMVGALMLCTKATEHAKVGPLIAMAGSLMIIFNALAVSLAILSVLNIDKLHAATNGLVLIFVSLGIALAAAASAGKNKAPVMRTVLLVAAITAALWALQSDLLKIKNIDKNVAALCAVLISIGISMKLMSSDTKNIKLGTITSAILTLVSVALSLSLIAAHPWQAIATATAAMFVCLSTVGHLLNKLSNIKFEKGQVTKLLAASLIVAEIGLTLSFVAQQDWASLAAAAAGMSVCMLVLAKVFEDISEVKIDWGIILKFAALTLEMVGIGLTLSLLSSQPWGNILAAALGLSATMAVLFIILKKLGELENINWKAIGALALVVVELDLVAIGLMAVAQRDWTSIAAAFVAMDATMVVLVGVLALLTKVKPNFLAILGLGAVVIELDLIAAALWAVAQYDWEQIVAAAVALNGTIIVVTAALVAMTILAAIVGSFAGVIGTGFAIIAAAFLAISIAVAIFAVGAYIFAEAVTVFVDAIIKLAEYGNSEEIKSVATAITSGFINGLWEGLSDLGSKFAGWVKGKFEEAFASFEADVITPIRLKGQEIVDGFKEGVETAWSTVKGWGEYIQEWWGETTADIATKIETVKQNGRDLINGFVGGLEEAWATVKSWGDYIQEWWGEKAGDIAGKVAELRTAGRNLVNGFKGGIDTAWVAVKSWPKLLQEWWNSKTGENSGVSEFIEKAKQWGADIIDGFWSGIKEAIANVKSWPDLLKEWWDGTIAGQASESIESLFTQKEQELATQTEQTVSVIPETAQQTLEEEPLGDTIQTWVDEGVDSVDTTITEDLGEDLTAGVAKGMESPSALDYMKIAFGNVADDSVDFGRYAYDSNSPAKIMGPLGEDVTAGVAEGMVDPAALGTLRQASAAMAEETVNSAASAFEQGFTWLAQQLSAAVASLGNAFSSLGIDFSNFQLPTIQFGTFSASVSAVSEQLGGLSGIAKGIKKEGFGKYVKNDVIPVLEKQGGTLGKVGKVAAEVTEKVEKYHNAWKDGTLLETIMQETGLADVIQDVKDAYEDATGAAEDYGDAGKKAGGGSKSSGDEAKKAAEAAELHAKAVKVETEVVKEFVDVYGEAYAELGETAAIDAAKEAILEMALAFGDAGSDMEDTGASVEKMLVDLYDKTKEAIAGSIDIFTEFKTEASGSAKDLIKAMDTNLTAMDEWGTKLEWMAARGFLPEIINKLREMGLKSLPLVNQMLKSSFDEMVQINDRYQRQVIATSEATKKALAAQAYAMKTSAAIAAMTTEDNKESMAAIQKSILDTAAEIQKVTVVYQELRDSLRDTLKGQVKYFDKVDHSSDVTFGELRQNLFDNINDLQQWGTDMTRIGGVASAEFVQYLASMGPEASDKIHAIATATDAEIKELDAGFQAMNALVETLSVELPEKLYQGMMNSAINVNAGFAAGFAASSSESVAEANNWGIKIVEAADEGLGNHSPSKKTYDSAKNVIQGFINGLKDSGLSTTLNTTVKDITDKVIEGFTQPFITAFGAGGKVGGGLGGGNSTGSAAVFEAFTTFIDDLFTKIHELFTEKVEGEGGLQTLVEESMKTTGEKFDQGLIDGMEDLHPDVIKTGQDLTTELNENTEHELASSVSRPYGQNFNTGILTGMNDIVPAINSSMSAMVNTVNAIASSGLSYGNGYSYGSNIMAGIRDGISSGIDACVEMMYSAAERIQGAFTKPNLMNSPSKLFMQYGGYLMEGLSIGIDQNTVLAEDSMHNVTSVMQEAMDSMHSLSDDIGDIQPTIKPVLDLSEVEERAKLLDSMFNDGHSVRVSNIKSLGAQINGIGRSNNISTTYGATNINIYPQPGMDANEIADLTLRKFNNQIKRRKAAFA